MKKRVFMFLKKNPRGTIAIIVAGIILCASFLLTMNSHTNKYALNSNDLLPFTARVISPQGVHILVRLVDTDKTRELGLSYFSQLPEKQGMLFSFPQGGTYGFWMKDMNFPIDIIWIDENLKIIDRTINVLPSTFPNIFTPKAPVKYVLEIPANTADQYGLFVDTSLSLQEYK